MAHTKQGRRRWKEKRKRRMREEARRRRIDEVISQPGYKEAHRREHVRYVMCVRKRGYRTEGEAIRGCLSVSAHTGGGLRPYRCPICGNWHITSRVEELA